MSQAVRTLLLSDGEVERSRRGLLRSLVLAPTVALATHELIFPSGLAAITPAEALARLKYHLDGCEAAFRSLFPMAEIAVHRNFESESDASLWAAIFEDRFVPNTLPTVLVTAQRAH